MQTEPNIVIPAHQDKEIRGKKKKKGKRERGRSKEGDAKETQPRAKCHQ